MKTFCRTDFVAPSLALALCSAPPALAAEVVNINTDTVVITANRVAQSVDDTLTPVTLITRKDIERSQARTLEDLLRGQPGISLANQGGPGKVTSLSLRGTNPGHVLVWVDGVKIGSASSGFIAFQDIPLEQIERIEIVRGPRSSLYGSEAIGGVIQIFTRQGGGPAKTALTVGAGSRGTTEAAASASGSWGTGGGFSMGVSHLGTQGFNACNSMAGCYTLEPDRDGYRNLSGRASLHWRGNEGLEMGLNWLRAAGDNDFDGSFQNHARTTQEILGASFGMMLSPNWRSRVSLGQNLDASRNDKDDRFASRFDSKRTTASWQNEVQLDARQQLTAGLDWQQDRIDSSTAYTMASRRNTGLFAQYRIDLAGHSVELSSRRDDNEQFGQHTTTGAAWGYALNPDTRLRASFGQAFKAPTFNDLYYPGYSNPALQPERSTSVDLGIAGGKIARWSFDVFDTRVRDLIVLDSATWIPANLDEARIRGLEATGAVSLGPWQTRAQLSLTDPRNDAAGPHHGKRLPRRATQALSLEADRDFGALRLGANLRAEGPRFDNVANTTRLPGFATADVRIEYRLDKAWRLQGRLENLFDREYETVAGFNQPGRGAFMTLRYQP